MDRRPRRAPPERALSVTIHWSAVLFGALTGFTASLGVFLVLGIAGVIDGESVLLIVLVYAGQLLAGYVGGRFAGSNGPLHGGLAALGLSFLTAALAVAAGTEPAVPTLALLLAVAAIIGTGGGALADHRRK